jgi:[FeFe] hydrogenase H-cluster maturation GTPase HydF
MSLQKTPNANRWHIGIFGKVNSGKSTLLNALTKQEVALVSKEKGTTTDPVYKAMEIHGMGPVVFIDTAGFNDISMLGSKRVDKTVEVTKKVDIALIVCADSDIEEELTWASRFKELNVTVLLIVNDMGVNNVAAIVSQLKDRIKDTVIVTNALEKRGIDKVKDALIKNTPKEQEVTITRDLVKGNDIVLLVMPQDIQAPKGRLILPQVQTIRELLDKKCIVISCTTDNLESAIQSLNTAPNLIICDSQVFKTVYEKKPKSSKLTSFSILFAGYKGDINTFIEGANEMQSISATSQILIVEACTHTPLDEDIGRVKIPRLLRQRYGQLSINIINGTDFPSDLTKYDLIIHCGACMFNRKHVLSRINEAKQQGVAITNYGIAIAYLQGILDKVSW